MKRHLGLLALFSVGLVTMGCTPMGSQGELSHGSFGYRCTLPGDSACDDDYDSGWDSLQVIPYLVAVGSRFGVDYNGDAAEGPDGTTYGVNVVPASPTMVERSGNELLVRSPGYLALLGRATNGVVVDFLHTRASTPVALIPTSNGAEIGSIKLASFASTSLRAHLVDAEGLVLAGGANYTFTVADPAIASATGTYGDNETTLEPISSGETSLQVSALGLSIDIPITVEP